MHKFNNHNFDYNFSARTSFFFKYHKIVKKIEFHLKFILLFYENEKIKFCKKKKKKHKFKQKFIGLNVFVIILKETKFENRS